MTMWPTICGGSSPAVHGKETASRQCPLLPRSGSRLNQIQLTQVKSPAPDARIILQRKSASGQCGVQPQQHCVCEQ